MTVARPIDLVADVDVDAANRAVEGAAASDIVRWAVDVFGDRVVVAASMTDAVLIDVASLVAPGIEVVFIDTGYHFPETLAMAEGVARRYDIRLNVLSAGLPPDGRWRPDPDGCCGVRKVAPLDELLAEREAWLTGLRRADGHARAEVRAVEHDRRGLVKVNPLAAWSDADVEAYIDTHDVAVNPLVAEGYPSIGCWPCTRPVRDGTDARAGRWVGRAKTECGLHLAERPADRRAG